jgi:PPOX class probable F420-dependent enzyme
MNKLNDKAIALLKGKNFVFLATVNKDGSPQVTPLWGDTDGKNVVLNTAIGRAKHRNITRDTRVAVSFHDLANPYVRVSLDGKVVKTIKGKEADDHIDSLSAKYTGNKKYTKSSPSEKRIILIIQPTRIREQ